jgi:uroporphyrinogen-III synthase
MDEQDMPPLQGRLIALPETRELDRLARMLEDQGAETLRCPLVAILDAPDPAPIVAWLSRFIAKPFDDLILLTGEGLRRLSGVAERSRMREPFIAALSATRKITRGPKPAQALRALGLGPDLRAAEPTTDGVIATLSGADLRGRTFGVQLYPGNPNLKLIEFLKGGGAVPDPITPYIYATEADDRKVLDLIDALAGGRVDVIAFTSSPQVVRLFEVAEKAERTPDLQTGLAQTAIAAVGPVVAAELQRHGLTVTITPTGETYFMKPLVTAIVDALGTATVP